MKLTANVIGATGLVGQQLVSLLLKNDRFEKIRIFVRRDSGIRHTKLEQQIVDFGKCETWEKQVSGDILFSALGTTLKQAGSKKRQFEIDYTYNLNFAKAAKTNGIENYVLVSSLGANSKSILFYPRMKGELDEAVSSIGFQNLVILRPSSLIGHRNDKRISEMISVPVTKFLTKFVLRKFKPIHSLTVAKAMINGVLEPEIVKTVWENPEVFSLSGEK